MMKQQPLTARAELKLRARRCMGGKNFAPCATLAAAVVVAALLAQWIYMSSDGVINLYYWSTAESDIQTSFSLSRQGLFAALRIEEAGAGLSVAITPALLGTFVLVRLLSTAVTAPLNVGALDNLWAIHRGETRPFGTVLRWYTDLRRAGRAVVMQVLLQAIHTLLQLVCIVPGVLVLTRSGGSMTAVTFGLWLMIAGQAAAWCLMTQLMPAKFLLARNCEMGVRAAFREGWTLLRGRHGEYLYLWLSFALWEVANLLVRGMMALYLFPYQGFANMEWLTECERCHPERSEESC